MKDVPAVDKVRFRDTVMIQGLGMHSEQRESEACGISVENDWLVLRLRRGTKDVPEVLVTLVPMSQVAYVWPRKTPIEVKTAPKPGKVG